MTSSALASELGIEQCAATALGEFFTAWDKRNSRSLLRLSQDTAKYTFLGLWANNPRVSIYAFKEYLLTLWILCALFK
jgi:hypothetical protein